MVKAFNSFDKRIERDVTVKDDKKIYFRDTGIYIHSSADGKLLISSDGTGADDITFSGNVTFNNDMAVSGTFGFGDTITGDLDIQGGDLQATTGALNIGKTGSTVTFKGDIDVDEAAVFNSTIDAQGNISSSTGNPNIDWSGSSGTWGSPTGTCTLNGSVILATTKTYTSGTGSAIGGVHTIYRDGAGATSLVWTPGTSVVIGENTTISGAYTLTTGTGLTTISGDMKVSGNNIYDSAGTAGITFDGSGNTAVDGDLTVTGNDIKDSGANTVFTFDGSGNVNCPGTLTAGTIAFSSASVAGNMDIVGTNLNATTGTLNLSKSGSMTTTLGTANFDEAVTMDSTLAVTGAFSTESTSAFGNAKADTNTFYGDIAANGAQNPDIDFSGSSGTFKTPTGIASYGGTNNFTGVVDFQANVTASTGNPSFDLSGSNAAFTTSSGTNTLSGAVVLPTTVTLTSGTGSAIGGVITVYSDGAGGKSVNITPGTSIIWGDNMSFVGAQTLSTGTGNVSLNGTTTIATTIDLILGTATAIGGDLKGYRDGAGNLSFDFNPGTSITLYENTAISGAYTFGTGTGAVSLNGTTTVATTIDLILGTGSAIGGDLIGYRDGAGNPSFNFNPGTSITLYENTSISGAYTFGTGTGDTTIGGDYVITGHCQAQEFTANNFNCPAPTTEWTITNEGVHMPASITAKKCWIRLNNLKIGDEIVSYKLIGDATETNALTLDCKLVKINNANPITTTDVAGGGITQVTADGVFDVLATLGAVETVATDTMYVLEILGTTAVADTITVAGAEVKVNRKT